MKRLLLLPLFVCLICSGAWAQTAQYLTQTPPSWIIPGAGADCDFANQRYWNCPTSDITVGRTGSATDLLPTSAGGASYNTFAAGTLRITPGLGLLAEVSVTNFLLNSTAPATQTTGSLAAATYTLWVNSNAGGTATMSAGTGTGCGTGVASQGTSVSFTITVAGTCTVTVSGTLQAFQLENASVGTSLIVTSGSTVTRSADAYGLSNRTRFVRPFTGQNVGGWVWSQTPFNTAASGGVQPIITDGGGSLYMITLVPTTGCGDRGNAVTQTATLGGSTTTTGIVKCMTEWATNARGAVGNNGTAVFTTFALTTSASGINIGNQTSATYLNGYISRLATGDCQACHGFGNLTALQ